jgi:SAM-dependent methyltransferase
MGNNMNIDYNFDADTYDKLYQRFISDSKTTRLAEAADFKGKPVIDLCAGSGRLSRKLIELGAKSVVAVDTNPHVLDLAGVLDFRILPYNTTVEDFAQGVSTSPMMLREAIRGDVIYCQQAINYWFSWGTVSNLANNCLTPDGEFCFNTFNRKPSYKPQTKVYGYDKYCETWYLVKERNHEMVYHLQCCEGIAPHFTKFRWIEEKEFNDVLQGIFKNVYEIRDGDTSIWLAKGVK